MSRKLKRELQSAGAAEHEIDELMRAAERLDSLHVPGMSETARARVAARLPVDIELQKSRRMPAVSLRWSAAGAFAALVIVAGVAFLSGLQQPGEQPGQQAHEVAQPEKTEQQLEKQLEQQSEELKQLQKQPVIDEKRLEKSKNKFQRDYKQYERGRARDKSQKNQQNPWNNYQSEWWWRQTPQRRQDKPTTAPGRQQSSDKQTDRNPGTQHRNGTRAFPR